MQARQANREPLWNRVGALEKEVDSLSDQLHLAIAKLQELTATHVATIDTLHANYKQQAELNKAALDKQAQYVGLLHFLLMSQQFSARRVSNHVHALECVG